MSNNDKIFLQIPKKSEYFSTARLMISGLAAILNKDIEFIEDLKMIVAEMCNLSFHLNKEDTICIAMESDTEKIKISVSGVSEELLKDKEELTIGELIISSLSDKVEYGENYILAYKYF